MKTPREFTDEITAILVGGNGRSVNECAGIVRGLVAARDRAISSLPPDERWRFLAQARLRELQESRP